MCISYQNRSLLSKKSDSLCCWTFLLDKGLKDQIATVLWTVARSGSMERNIYFCIAAGRAFIAINDPAYLSATPYVFGTNTIGFENEAA